MCNVNWDLVGMDLGARFEALGSVYVVLTFCFNFSVWCSCNFIYGILGISMPARVSIVPILKLPEHKYNIQKNKQT
jgi:hypothetical protein